jgi:FkbM family methyltransferase
MTGIAISAAQWQADNAEHLRYEYDLSPDSLVFDIGAYKGDWAREIYRRYQCKLICIEPTNAILGFDQGEVINKAASTNEGTIRFGGADDRVSAFADGEQEYPCFDINELLSEHEEIDLVKINIEGAEYHLLNHVIDAKLHKRMKNLQVQFHQVEGEPFEEMYGAIASKLSETHRPTFLYRFCWENWRRGRELDNEARRA